MVVDTAGSGFLVTLNENLESWEGMTTDWVIPTNLFSSFLEKVNAPVAEDGGRNENVVADGFTTTGTFVWNGFDFRVESENVVLAEGFGTVKDVSGDGNPNGCFTSFKACGLSNVVIKFF